MAEALRLSDFKQNVDAMLRQLPDEMLQINQELALLAKAKITQRLTEQGLTAEGKSLGTYSTRPMSPLFFLGHGLKSADTKLKAKLKQQKKAGQKPGISYKDWREINNLPVDHVTLSFTTDTLKDVDVLSSTTSDNKAVTTVGSRDSKTKEIFNSKGKKTGSISTGQVLDQLDEKYGSALDTELLSLSPEEEKLLADVLDQKLQSFLDKNFA